jgi:crotonobetainyl-CoA:carnitine CoA-transferase CaiB-like acyl-CoA transferase
LKLSPVVLLVENPKLVVVRVSGFGQTGPYSHRPGFGTLAEAYSGYSAINGYDDRPPLLAPTALADEVSGLFATWALMVALYGREVHGLPGQTIDVSLFESVFAMLGPLPALYQHTGYLQSRNGSRLPFSSPRNVYRTRDGAYYAISGTAPAAAERVIEMVGGEELLADPRFCTHEVRAEHADELDGIVADWVAEHDLEEIEALAESAAVAGIRVMSMKDIFEDRHYAARESFVQVRDDALEYVAMAAPVPRFSVTPGRIEHAGSRLGSDTRNVLAELGYEPAEIDRMSDEGVW